MPRKLKVFRTPTGFHDAYVAAPSRKAALDAWGATADLFARGSAEEITDARLMAEPLKHPGEVIRVSRGDLKAQLNALGPRKQRAGKISHGKEPPQRQAVKPSPRRTPPPKRDKVDRAEAALDAAREKQAGERAALDKQREAIERKIAALEARQRKALTRLEQRLESTKEAYREAVETWGG